MIERDSCYFCTSPYQLFAIMSLAITRTEKADLYIDPQFAGAEEFAERIRNEAVFETVVVIDHDKIWNKYIPSGNALSTHLRITKAYFHVQEIADMILIPNVRYRNMFVSSRAFLPRMVQLSFIKGKKEVNVFYIEDGIGTYSQDRACRLKPTDKIIRTVLFGRQAARTDYKRYVFSPTIYKKLGNQFEVEGLARIWENDDGRRMMNTIFASENAETDSKVIILDQPRSELLTEEGNNSFNQVLRLMSEHFGKENVVLKKHPRSKDKELGDLGLSTAIPNVPFEMLCMNNDMNGKVLITHSSTAVATPKIMFGQEPAVIVLSSMIPTRNGEYGLCSDTYQMVRDSYSDPKTFIISKTIECLTSELEALGKSVHADA